jgi:atypical dual specificity phosphatase
MFLQTNDYGAPSLQQLDYVVSYIGRQIDNGKPIMVHCSDGRGRTGTILAAYLIKKGNVLNAYQTINRLRNIRGESIQSKEQEDIVFS